MSVKKLGEDAITRRGTAQGKFKIRRRTDGALLNLDEPIGNVLRNNDFVDLGNKNEYVKCLQTYVVQNILISLKQR